jgi:hypothetical protein
MKMQLKWRVLEEMQEGNDLPGSPAPQLGNDAVNEPDEDTGVDWDSITSVSEDEVPEAPKAEIPPAAEANEPEADLGNAPALENPDEAAALNQPQQMEQQQVQFTPEQIAAAEQAYADKLASFYSFDEDAALRLQTEPEKVLPQLAARLHMDVMKNIMTQMQMAVPQMIQGITANNAREQSAQNVFYTAWPELKGYDQQVLHVGRMFRQMNPNASPDEAVKRIGEIALATLGIQRPTQAQAPAPQQQQAFRPSVPGRVSAPAQAQDFWGNMSDDDEF